MTHWKYDLDVILKDGVFFGNFLDPHNPSKKYVEIPSIRTIKNSIEGYCDEYNSDHKIKINLVLFDEAV